MIMIRCMLLMAACVASGASAFTSFRVNPPLLTHSPSMISTALHAATESSSSSSRRDFFARSGTASILALTAAVRTPQPARAASGPPTKEELARIQTGYDGIQYLLAHWEAETTVCRENGGECKRDADPVRKYMGLRSTTDPLFQIEKVFAKVRFMDGLDQDKLDDFFEATEGWNTAMSMSNSMAFISQFGEYNPGGGKEEVLKYLNEAETQVKLAEKNLRVILDYVNSASP